MRETEKKALHYRVTHAKGTSMVPNILGAEQIYVGYQRSICNAIGAEILTMSGNFREGRLPGGGGCRESP